MRAIFNCKGANKPQSTETGNPKECPPMERY